MKSKTPASGPLPAVSSFIPHPSSFSLSPGLRRLLTPHCLAAAAIIGLALLLHWRVAVGRSTRLLEHDEAISLLAAAGKSKQMGGLYAQLNQDCLQVIPAKDLQDLTRPTGQTGLADVLESLAGRDIHPPLYFVTLHWIQRLAVTSNVLLRLFGTCLFLAAAWATARWVWPDAPPHAKLMGLALILTTPALVGIATELRQYALVSLGTLFSFAALITYWEARRPILETIILMSLAPALLIWSQYGTAVWVAITLFLAAVRLFRGPPVCRKTFAGSVLIGIVLIVPLFLWQSYFLTVATRSAQGTVSLATLSEAASAISSGAGQAWCSLPERWHDPTVWILVVVVVLIISGAIVLTRRAAIDQVLYCAAAAWAVVWVVWLACEKVPQHAVSPKHLAPLLFCPLVLLVRATASVNPPWMRRLATTLLAASLLTHVGISAMRGLTERNPQRTVMALRSADCLLIDVPKRGYILPLVAQMKPEARVIIASPETAIAHWLEMNRLFPNEGLIVAEIDSCHGGRRAPGAQEFFDRLSRTYRDVAALRKGPHRTITEFKNKLSLKADS